MGADGIEPFFLLFRVFRGGQLQCTCLGPLAARDLKRHDGHLMSVAIAACSLREGVGVL